MASKGSNRPSAGQTLETHIRALGKSIPIWCDEHGLTKQRVQIQRLINGERAKRVSVNLALAIEKATDGAVPMTIWANTSADESGPHPAITASKTGTDPSS